MVTLLVVPLSLTKRLEFIQFVVVKSAFVCKTNPVEGDGHETRTLLFVVSTMFNDGAASEKEKSSNAKSFPYA